MPIRLTQGYKSKFDSLGLDVPAEEIFSSSFAAAAYLEQVLCVFPPTFSPLFSIFFPPISFYLPVLPPPSFIEQMMCDDVRRFLSKCRASLTFRLCVSPFPLNFVSLSPPLI